MALLHEIETGFGCVAVCYWRGITLQFISSESAPNMPTEVVHYGVSKDAIRELFRGFVKVLAGTGVSVNTTLPRPIRTEGTMERMAGMVAERGISTIEMEALFLKENRPSILLRRFVVPEEVTNLCVYAASTQASATTDAALRAEGEIVGSIS